jgi:hypothetical protein
MGIKIHSILNLGVQRFGVQGLKVLGSEDRGQKLEGGEAKKLRSRETEKLRSWEVGKLLSS